VRPPSKWRGGRRVSLEVEHERRELHRADAVGQHVVQLCQEGRAAALEAVDQGCLPQRASPVEAGHRRGPGQLHDRRERRGLRSLHAPEVEAEVEVGIVRPHERRQPGRWLGDALTHHRDELCGELHARHEGGPIRRAVEQRDPEGRRPQVGIRLLDPEERVVLVQCCADELHHGEASDVLVTRVAPPTVDG
jgi:hypothetical protein